ncbi:MAG: hypothetical protein DRP12_03505 [Candidatus Aenigmatarchaeota archaeon]|nr:MAG: hypothetical protein DRP12_03505 [Candidatus Aenigmarchaeota archaeon]
MPERLTASKVRISDLINGKWVDTPEGPRLELPWEEKVSRVRVLATVVSRFQSEDGKFSTLTLDDGTETIRLKVFQGSKMLEGFQPGDLIDVVGKIKQFEGETYILPETIRKVDDPNLETLRRLEILLKIKRFKPQESEKELLKKKVLEEIEKAKDGIEYEKLLKLAPEDRIEQVVNELLGEGICYEPSPGRIKKV